MYVRNVVEPLASTLTLQNIQGSTLERSPTRAVNAAKPSVGAVPWCSIVEYTQARSPMSAPHVVKPSVRAPSSPYTSVSIPGRSPTHVVSVARPLAEGQPFLSTRGFTRGEPSYKQIRPSLCSWLPHHVPWKEMEQNLQPRPRPLSAHG